MEDVFNFRNFILTQTRLKLEQLFLSLVFLKHMENKAIYYLLDCITQVTIVLLISKNYLSWKIPKIQAQ